MLDDDEDFQRLQRAARNRKRLLYLFVAGLLLVALYPVYSTVWRHYQHAQRQKLTSSEREDLERFLSALEGRAREDDQRWRQAVTRAALDNALPSEDPCPVRLSAPTLEAAESYVKHGSIDGNYYGNWSIRYLREGAEPGPCGDCRWLEQSVERVRQKVAAGEAKREDLSWARRRAESTRRSPPEVFLLVDHEEKGFVTAGMGEATFTPSLLVGRAVVYGPDDGQFLCAADVRAQSSKDIPIYYRYFAENPLDQSFQASAAAQGALVRDLEVQVRRAISQNLRSLEP